MKVMQDVIVSDDIVYSDNREVESIVENVLMRLFTKGLSRIEGRECRVKWDYLNRHMDEINAQKIRTILQIEEIAGEDRTMWILCKDELPRVERDLYIVQDDRGEMQFATYEDGEWRNSLGYTFRSFARDVIAWRKAPVPLEV